MISVSPTSTNIVIRGFAKMQTIAEIPAQKIIEIPTALFSPARIREFAFAP